MEKIKAGFGCFLSDLSAISPPGNRHRQQGDAKIASQDALGSYSSGATGAVPCGAGAAPHRPKSPGKGKPSPAATTAGTPAC